MAIYNGTDLLNNANRLLTTKTFLQMSTFQGFTACLFQYGKDSRCVLKLGGSKEKDLTKEYFILFSRTDLVFA